MPPANEPVPAVASAVAVSFVFADIVIFPSVLFNKTFSPISIFVEPVILASALEIPIVKAPPEIDVVVAFIVPRESVIIDKLSFEYNLQ